MSDTQVKKFFPDAAEREKRYLKNIRALKNILRGRKKSVIEGLERDMKRLGQEKKFEEAAAVRDELRALENIFRHQRMVMREIDPERAKALSAARELLRLPDLPRRIEGYDISNTQGSSAVGSMVVFENGQPKKSDYRRFIIRLTPLASGADDFAMLQEVLMRRLRHPKWPLPDLFLIDGGKGQLSAAKAILEAAHIKIPVVSLAKREEELWLSSEKHIALKRVPPPLLFLFQHIRNEAHRFAISYHRKKRSKAFLDSAQ
ncbi:MAG: UvrB/UvrC motif-containing protein [Patescibacteria group bacterium]